MNFHYNDGGREAAGYKGKTGDCVARAIAIAMGRDYQHVCDDIEDRKSTRLNSSHRT